VLITRYVRSGEVRTGTPNKWFQATPSRCALGAPEPRR
jgi:hypothetical protein